MHTRKESYQMDNIVDNNNNNNNNVRTSSDNSSIYNFDSNYQTNFTSLTPTQKKKKIFPISFIEESILAKFPDSNEVC